MQSGKEFFKNMKYYLISDNDNLKAAVGRSEKQLSLTLVSSPIEAELILVDGWVEPADKTKIYGYFGPSSAGHILQKYGKILYPESLSKHENAFYFGITEFYKLIPEMSAKKSAKPSSLVNNRNEGVIVIVDDNEEWRVNAKLAFPDAVVFGDTMEALSFIQNGTAKIKAVLTDLVMPIKGEQQRWEQEVINAQPSGLLVYMAAKARSIPVIIVSAGHSATPLEEFFRYSFVIIEKITLVGDYPKTKEVWLKAYDLVETK